MADVWEKVVRAVVDFVEKRGEAYAAGSFASPKALITALAAGNGTHQTLLSDYATTIGDGAGLSADDQKVFDGIKKNIADAATELTKVKQLLANTEFTLSNAKDSATSIGKIASGYTDAIGSVAKKLAAGNATVEADINEILEPWVEGFGGVASGATSKFDELCNTILGVDNATSDLVHAIQLDLAEKRINIVLASVGSHSLGPITFDGAEIKGFVSYDPPSVGLSLNTAVNAGLESDPFMSKIMPGGAKANTDPVAIQLDTDKGFSLGGGKTTKIVLPARLSLPLVELRELALAIPVHKEGDPARFDIELSLAGKLGDVIGFIVEGVGVSLISQDGGSWSVQAKQPDGIGIKIKAGPVSGGGYLRYDGTQYGGALQLGFYSIGLSAMGLYMPSKNALLVIIGVKFTPEIQIGFGFSINGIGGLLASQRKISIDALSTALKDGAVSNILMPDDPVSNAPKILDQLAKIFPPAEGIFVVGPIVELGWGSKSGLVVAKVGVMIQFPDPAVVILGSLSVKVPPKIDPASKVPAVVDLNVDIFAAITPDEFFLKASLIKSKIAGLAIGGDLALLIKWGGDAVFAFSAGGFFPTYKYPPELAGLQRLSLSLSPPVPILKVTVTAYIAVTSNSVQFGGAVKIVATVGPASGEADLSLDAMFIWSPRFAFIIQFSASISIKVFGASIAGASFRGTLQGTRPWSLEGDASVSFLFWDFDFHIGPIEWGDHDASVLPLIDSLAEVIAAFNKDTAWTALPPALDNAVTIARSGDDMANVLQPFSLIQANQQVAPFDMTIERLGSYESTVKQFGFANPMINSAAAPAVSEIKDEFAPGQFKNLTQDQKASSPDFEEWPGGIQMAPSTGIAIGATADATIEWETFFPTLDQKPGRMKWALEASVNRTILSASAVGKARRNTGNPYAPAEKGPVAIAEAGLVQIVPMTARSTATVAAQPTSAAISALFAANAAGEEMQMVALGLAA